MESAPCPRNLCLPGSHTPATLSHLRDSGICSERPGTVLCSDNGTDGPLNHRNLDSSNRFQRDCQIGVLNSEQNLFVRVCGPRRFATTLSRQTFLSPLLRGFHLGFLRAGPAFRSCHVFRGLHPALAAIALPTLRRYSSTAGGMRLPTHQPQIDEPAANRA